MLQIRLSSQIDVGQLTSTERLALASDIQQLDRFLAAAGHVEASIMLSGSSDPPFVFANLATAELLFPKGPGLNGTVTVNTTGIFTDDNCASPFGAVNVTMISPKQLNVASTMEVNGCTAEVTFNPQITTQQYGVVKAPCSDSLDSDPNFQPVMFWYFHMRKGTPEVKTVFCSPTIRPSGVTVIAHLEGGQLEDVKPLASNNVTDFSASFGGKAFNGLFFNDSTDPFIQARASAIQSIAPGAIFLSAVQRPEGLQAVFDRPSGMLSLTSQVYTQYLTISARLIYFVKQNTTITAETTSLLPRLFIDPLPTHILASLLLFTGLVGIFVHVLHRHQRKKLILAAPPGSIASIIALTAWSDFEKLGLYPYDNEDMLERKLKDIRFRLDERSGAIVADDVSLEAVSRSNRDERMLALLGRQQYHDPSGGSSSWVAYKAAVGL